MKSILFALFFAAVNVQAADPTVLSSLNGEWEGSGVNVYYGPYTATWKGQPGAEKNQLIQGELTVIPENLKVPLKFQINVIKYLSSFGPTLVVELKDANEHSHARTVLGVGDWENLVVAKKTDKILYSWRHISAPNGWRFLRGMRIGLSDKGQLFFGFTGSYAYCPVKVCATDAYLPFYLNKKLK